MGKGGRGDAVLWAESLLGGGENGWGAGGEAAALHVSTDLSFPFYLAGGFLPEPHKRGTRCLGVRAPPRCVPTNTHASTSGLTSGLDQVREAPA